MAAVVGQRTDKKMSESLSVDVPQVRAFTDAALTRNQKAAADGVQSLFSRSSLYDAMVQLPTDAVARGAFDQVSREVHASAKTALIEDSRFVRNAAIWKLPGNAILWSLGTMDGVHAEPMTQPQRNRTTRFKRLRRG